MKRQVGPSALALAALLLCAAQHGTFGGSSASASASPSKMAGGKDAGMPRRSLKHHSNGSLARKPTPVSPVKWSPPLCAYQVTEGGIGGALCFRHMLLGYTCREGDCRSAVSSGSLVANILRNGSVLLQWSQGGTRTPDRTGASGANSSSVYSGRRHKRGGYELSCLWNGSYTQFECPGVNLGSGCEDYLLSELHENIPYRICLRSHEAERKDCVEFTLPPSGMQDIVIAMTTVGGAICVMLVIICLLVAYITENIMSPATQHTYSYRTRSRH
ncbi:fibronectin type III domain-containing protein 10 [Stigmatopora nigra]